ncbi:MAG: glutathione-disulfide reductase [Magnetovibrio sp.]|nr:glutathione-disulfide reductase [Magnetovibrio sp.]
MAQYDYDLITIGAGSGGVRASRFAASRYGKRTAVIENRRVGGTCVMRGCVPKKLLVYGAHFADEFADAAGYGWQARAEGFDWGALVGAKNAELDRLEGVYHRILREANVAEINGTGIVTDAHTVEVDGKAYTAEHILVATGGHPVMPKIPGIEHVITSDEALDLAALPERIVIVGGGYIAVEFAGIFNALGVETHLIVRADNILRGFDDAVRNTLRDEMARKGVQLHCETKVNSIERENGNYSLHLDMAEMMDTDLVMYATGRRPNTRGLGLEEAGVELNGRGAVVVDATSKTAVDSIYAIGDVTDRVNLTPVALAEGMAVAETLFGGKPTTVDYANIASAVFSQPPVGTVGLSEAEARENHDIDIYVSRFKPMKFTLSGRDENAMMKLIVDRDTDRVLGCHMVGQDAPEIIQGFAVALKCGATKAQFDATVGIHPTAAEEFVTMRQKLPEHDA